jgi:serine phosphatase RsbU (regulator of sigma subunit)
MLDGTERLGVMGLSFDAAPDHPTIAVCERYAHLAAMLIIAKGAYGDVFERTRRLQPMTVASELLWSLVPPLVFATDGLVVAGMLEPCYDNGGDAFDYAVDDGTLHIAIFDAMGHGLIAAGLAAFAVAAYRHSRRAGASLLDTYTAMDAAIAEQFAGERFVTAVIGRLDIASGRLSWISAGHPPPLVLRDGRRARTLSAPPATPLGVEHAAVPEIAHTGLEPDDMLVLYTDGLTEARGADGRRFTVQQLSEFIEREAAGGLSAPETLRRLRHTIVGRHGAELTDDATALVVEWHRGGERQLLPQTVGNGR